ncbi:hypothetical protein D3C73_1347830 [compost metagenome]
MFQRAATQRVALPGRTIGVDQPLGHQEQADALDARGGVGQSGEHQVNDVVAEVLFAAADENLAAAELVAAVGLRLGAGAQQCQVGSGLGLGEAHGAGPLAADQWRQITLFERVSAMAMQGQDRAFGQPGIDPERQ